MPEKDDKFSLLNMKGQSVLDKVLLVIIIAAILGAIGMLGYVLTTPKKTGERFTEFYILGSQGKADNYATELRLGEEGGVIVGIVNRELRKVSYRLEVTINQTRNVKLYPLVLEHGEKWEEEVSFTPTEIGDNQKVEFWLYEEGETYVKEQLCLWISVRR